MPGYSFFPSQLIPGRWSLLLILSDTCRLPIIKSESLLHTASHRPEAGRLWLHSTGHWGLPLWSPGNQLLCSRCPWTNLFYRWFAGESPGSNDSALWNSLTEQCQGQVLKIGPQGNGSAHVQAQEMKMWPWAQLWGELWVGLNITNKLKDSQGWVPALGLT